MPGSLRHQAANRRALTPLSRTALVAIGAAVLFWTAYSTQTQYNLDGYGDMVENYGWGIGWQWGYSKHPPLFGWITAAWFELFPRTDSAYYLLSAVNAQLAVLAGLFVARPTNRREHCHERYRPAPSEQRRRFARLTALGPACRNAA